MFNIFGSSSPFDPDVEKATSAQNTSEQWDVIIDICDKAGVNSKNAKDCIRSIMKRMSNNDPHVAIQAIVLLDACIKNCGRNFHLEVASRDFETEFQRLLTKVPGPVAQKMRVSLKKWAENEFKTDQEFNLIPSLYLKLKNEGVDFNDSMPTIKSQQSSISKDPNIVSSQQEEDDLARAIELSLKDKNDLTSTLYPNMASAIVKDSPTKQSRVKSGRKVRALYDFEAAEDNELTFYTGEFICVLDDTDANWWSGVNDRGREGLFPSNFVTADLNATENQYEKSDMTANTPKMEYKAEVIEIDEFKINQLLHLLTDADPEDPSKDTDEMFSLESQVHKMLPLIDNELERIDRTHARLTQLSTSLVEAINLYHMLMRESDLQERLPSYRQSFGPYYGTQPNAEYIGNAIGPQYHATTCPEDLQHVAQQQLVHQQYSQQTNYNPQQQYYNEIQATRNIMQSFAHHAPYMTPVNTVVTSQAPIPNSVDVAAVPQTTFPHLQPSVTPINQSVPNVLHQQASIPTYHQQQ